MYKPKGDKPGKSTLHKHISRYDKRAGCSKKKILLLYNFYDQMHVNAVALHLQHKWMPYPLPTIPATFILLNYFSKLPPLSFHRVLLIFFFQGKINRIWHDLPSFFGWLVLLLFTFSSCSEKFLFLCSSLTSLLLEFLYHSSLLCKLVLILHLTFHYLSRGCKRDEVSTR